MQNFLHMFRQFSGAVPVYWLCVFIPLFFSSFSHTSFPTSISVITLFWDLGVVLDFWSSHRFKTDKNWSMESHYRKEFTTHARAHTLMSFVAICTNMDFSLAGQEVNTTVSGPRCPPASFWDPVTLAFPALFLCPECDRESSWWSRPETVNWPTEAVLCAWFQSEVSGSAQNIVKNVTEPELSKTRPSLTLASEH